MIEGLIVLGFVITTLVVLAIDFEPIRKRHYEPIKKNR
jgi:hypothetical protein